MKNPVDGFSVGLADDNNIYEWQCMMEGPPESDYEGQRRSQPHSAHSPPPACLTLCCLLSCAVSGGYFPCSLSFPKEYPNKPPVMRFLTPNFWHPNVYKDGTVCISILHEAKQDEYNAQEKMSEKWRPILGVEAVLVSVLSMLSDPNFESPANVDASVELKRDPKLFKQRVRKLVRETQDAL
jgi:ubiquitin-conjugating enzyme E2 G1